MSWAKKIPPGKPQERFSRPRAGSSTPQMASLRNENLMEGEPNLNSGSDRIVKTTKS
jgi:hypothetical protein